MVKKLKKMEPENSANTVKVYINFSFGKKSSCNDQELPLNENLLICKNFTSHGLITRGVYDNYSPINIYLSYTNNIGGIDIVSWNKDDIDVPLETKMKHLDNIPCQFPIVIHVDGSKPILFIWRESRSRLTKRDSSSQCKDKCEDIEKYIIHIFQEDVDGVLHYKEIKNFNLPSPDELQSNLSLDCENKFSLNENNSSCEEYLFNLDQNDDNKLLRNELSNFRLHYVVDILDCNITWFCNSNLLRNLKRMTKRNKRLIKNIKMNYIYQRNISLEMKTVQSDSPARKPHYVEVRNKPQLIRKIDANACPLDYDYFASILRKEKSKPITRLPEADHQILLRMKSVLDLLKYTRTNSYAFNICNTKRFISEYFERYFFHHITNRLAQYETYLKDKLSSENQIDCDSIILGNRSMNIIFPSLTSQRVCDGLPAVSVKDIINDYDDDYMMSRPYKIDEKENRKNKYLSYINFLVKIIELIYQTGSLNNERNIWIKVDTFTLDMILKTGYRNLFIYIVLLMDSNIIINNVNMRQSLINFNDINLLDFIVSCNNEEKFFSYLNSNRKFTLLYTNNIYSQHNLTKLGYDINMLKYLLSKKNSSSLYIKGNGEIINNNGIINIDNVNAEYQVNNSRDGILFPHGLILMIIYGIEHVNSFYRNDNNKQSIIDRNRDYIIGNEAEVFRYLYRIDPLRCRAIILHSDNICNNIDILKYCYEEGVIQGHDFARFYENALQENNIEIMLFIDSVWHHHFSINERQIFRAIKHAHMDVIKKFFVNVETNYVLSSNDNDNVKEERKMLYDSDKSTITISYPHYYPYSEDECKSKHVIHKGINKITGEETYMDFKRTIKVSDIFKSLFYSIDYINQNVDLFRYFMSDLHMHVFFDHRYLRIIIEGLNVRYIQYMLCDVNLCKIITEYSKKNEKQLIIYPSFPKRMVRDKELRHIFNCLSTIFDIIIYCDVKFVPSNRNLNLVLN